MFYVVADVDDNFVEGGEVVALFGGGVDVA